MKKNLTLLMLCGVLTLSASQLSAQNKIGYISSQELLSVMPETQAANKQLTDLRDAMVKNAQDKEARLNADIEKFNKDSAQYSDAVKQVKRQEMQKTYQELANEDQNIQQQLQQKQQELLAPIQKKANEAVQTVAKESGYGYVFEKDALIVAPPGDDLLPLVAKKLGIKLPAANAPAAAPPAKTGGNK